MLTSKLFLGIIGIYATVGVAAFVVGVLSHQDPDKVDHQHIHLKHMPKNLPTNADLKASSRHPFFADSEAVDDEQSYITKTDSL